MACERREENRKACPCSHRECSRHGLCCQCVEYHREKRQLPACFFTAEEEKTLDRSLEFFLRGRT